MIRAQFKAERKNDHDDGTGTRKQQERTVRPEALGRIGGAKSVSAFEPRTPTLHPNKLLKTYPSLKPEIVRHLSQSLEPSPKGPKQRKGFQILEALGRNWGGKGALGFDGFE